MSEPMMITQEMKDSREKAVSKIIDRINDDIKRAVERGYHNALFNCDWDNPFYKEVRQKFESRGYRVQPTGYLNGYWQRTEDIVW